MCIICIFGFWGDICVFWCLLFCNGGVCDKINGDCIYGCIVGYYGFICDKNCSYGCVGVLCNKESGICISGCK